MSIKLEIPCNPYDNRKLYRRKSIELNPGVTVLVGCNGSGKTTILNFIKDKFERDKNVIYIKFDNLHDGGHFMMDKFCYQGDMLKLATMFCSSEGENIFQCLAEIASAIGFAVRNNRDNNKDLIITFDAVDSGLSVDNIIDLKECLFKPIIEDNSNRNVYIICSANEYELCNNENCFDVTGSKYIRFPNYDEYRDFIIKSREYKEKTLNA